jgi:hypothetical protein
LLTRTRDQQSVVDRDDEGVELSFEAHVLELQTQGAVRVLASA